MKITSRRSDKFRINKIALILSTILSAVSLPVFAAGEIIVVDNNTPRHITNGTDFSALLVTADDAVVTFDDDFSLASSGINGMTGLFSDPRLISVSGGAINLGSGASILYTPIPQSDYGSAISLSAASSLTANDLAISNSDSLYNITGLHLSDTSQATLSGLTEVVNGSINTYDDATFNAENIKITNIDSSENRLMAGGHGLFLNGANHMISGDVDISMYAANSSVLTGIGISADASFAGKTTVNAGSLSATRPRLVYAILLDDHNAPGNPETHHYFFNDVVVNVNSGTNINGFTYVGIMSEITVNNIDVALSNPFDTAVGIMLNQGEQWGYSPEYQSQPDISKIRINNANIRLAGNSDARLIGFHSPHKDVVVGNINIQSEGGKNAYLLYQTNAQFTGDVTLGSRPDKAQPPSGKKCYYVFFSPMDWRNAGFH